MIKILLLLSLIDSLNLSYQLKGNYFSQSGLGACVSCAVGHLIVAHESKKGVKFIPAPQFIHNSIRACGAATNFRNANEIIEKNGICRYETLPYIKDEKLLPPSWAVNEAKNHKYKLKAVSKTVDSVKKELNFGNMIAIAMNTFSQMQSDNYFFEAKYLIPPKPPFDRQKDDHAVVICGYSSNGFLIVDSAFGQIFYTMSYDYFNKYVYECYKIESIEGDRKSKHSLGSWRHKLFNNLFD